MKFNKETDPAEKRRAYMREYQRERRAKKKRQAINGEVESTKKITRRTKSTKLATYSGDIVPLHALDTIGHNIGVRALQLAASALENVEPERLRPIDIKRLVDLGVKMRTVCTPGLPVEETEVEEQIIMRKSMMADDKVLDAQDELLRLTAPELHEDRRQEARLNEPGGLCEGGEPGDVATL